MKIGDYVYTPRFCTVRIEVMFESVQEAREAGYKEPTHFQSSDYGIYGKSLDKFHMVFAGFRK